MSAFPFPNPRTGIAGLADRFGATASFLCAVHCAALPFVIALLPALGLGFLADHGFERGFVAFASVLASWSIGSSYRRHRVPLALWLLVPGLALLWLGAYLIDSHEALGVHALLVACGGLLLTSAHVINLRLGHLHADGVECRQCAP